MDQSSFDIPDSTDWLSTPLPRLTPLESSLRCQVCKDFFDNPVITSCSHTFCSLCIRRCLSTEGKCPACRSSDQELKLRRNWVVQELVEAFRDARPSMLELASKAMALREEGGDDTLEQPSSKKRRVDGSSNCVVNSFEDVADSSEGRQTRSRSRRLSQSQNQMGVVTEVNEDSQDEGSIQEDGLVACPICNQRMKNEIVFQHLDICPGDSSSLSKQTSSGSLKPESFNTNKRPDRLPAMNYSILKDAVFRKKLRDLGIPDWGPRPLLQRRHTEWMNLWNANCDSKAPKSKRELLKELDIWERTQGGHAAVPSSFAPANPVMRKDFDGATWSANHDTDFKRLIASARQRSDTVARTTITQVHAAQNEPEISSPEPSIRTANTPNDVRGSEELPKSPSGVAGTGKEVFAYRNINDTQAINAGPVE